MRIPKMMLSLSLGKRSGGRRLRLALAQARIEADPDVWKQLNELPEDSPLTISIDDSALADLAAGFAVKRCDRQVRDRGDLWCDASSANDKTASGQIEGRVVAPTSTPICAACDVPDSRIRCTALMHPEVTGVRAFGGTHERSLNWAICDAGHQGQNHRSATAVHPRVRSRVLVS
jgi:hypothetical protein